MPVSAAQARDAEASELLTAFAERCTRLFVLTGAGCSTESGIPDYRDADGAWKRNPPIQWRQFASSTAVRRRYWARGLVGWRGFAAARPNPAHRALARLEAAGAVHHLVTQNVDGLHQRAGSRQVIDLHGRLDRVACVDCEWRESRRRFQRRLEELNREWLRREADGPGPDQARLAPDGDADLLSRGFDAFRVPPCPYCGSTVRPGFVFFGESVPRGRASRAFARLAESDGMLVVGSSLQVWSGYRFARQAVTTGLPLAILNLGVTRADGIATLKVRGRCGEVLPRVAESLGIPPLSTEPR